MSTSGAPVSSASRLALAGDWHVSSVPWTSNIGHLTDRQIASTASRSNGNDVSDSASIASTDPSSAQPVASSIAFVECGSEVISVKKNSAKPA